MTALIGLPALFSGTARLRTGLAADELIGVLRQSKSYAVRYSSRVGMKLFVDPAGQSAVGALPRRRR